MRKKLFKIISVLMAVSILSGCGFSDSKADRDEAVEAMEIQVFAANSLNDVLLELSDVYYESHPGIKIVINALGSQELRRQIENGMACDVFISANMDQMTKLDENSDRDYIQDGSIVKLLTNELVLITGKDSETNVTDFQTIPECKGVFALAGKDVPVGDYSRQAFEAIGITAEVFALSIDEKTKVGDVRSAVAQGMAEIGTVYKSDAYGAMDKLNILDTADAEWFVSPIVYPMALINNDHTDTDAKKAAKDFYIFLQSDEAAEIFEKYMFTRYTE